MAHSVNSLLEKIFGSVRKLTFYTLNTQPVVRKKAKFIYNPQTIKQQANRSNVHFLIYAFRTLRPLLIISLNSRPKSRSAYNEFLSRNLNQSIINGQFFPEEFQISTGDIPSTDFQVIRLVDESNKFLISWDEALNGNQNNEDILCAAIYTRTNKRFHYSITDVPREQQTAQIVFNLNFHTVACFLYLFFVRADYSVSSISSIHSFDVIN